VNHPSLCNAAGTRRLDHWLRQRNRTEAATLMQSLGEQPTAGTADERAARLVGVAQRNGLSVDAASLQHVARMIALSERPQSRPDARALRELAHAQAQARAPAADQPSQRPSQRGAPSAGSRDLLHLQREPTPVKQATTPRPAPGQPITQIAAFVETGNGRRVLNLAEADLRGIKDLPAQLRDLRRTEGALEIDLRRADLSGMTLNGADLSRARLDGANLQGSNLRQANLNAVSLKGANLRNADLGGTRLHANCDGANLAGAWLVDANLAESSFIGADLSRAKMARADLSRADLQRANLTDADLSAAYLPHAQLNGAVLEGTNLNGASLYRADLSGAHVAGAHLVGVNLTEATLVGSNLSAADLSRANLGNADLSGANLTHAVVDRANLRGAKLVGSNQLGVDWSRAIDPPGSSPSTTQPALDTPQAIAPRVRPDPTSGGTTASSPTASTVEPAEQVIVRDLMARYRIAPEIRTPRMERIVLAEIDSARQNELRIYQQEGQLPADVLDGSSTETQFLARTASLANYAQFIQRNPERFQVIANHTVYAETRFQALSTEAANGGVLREPQLRVVKGEADPLRQAYLIHRTLSTAIETLESDWSSRADGRSPSATHVGYADAMALLADKSVAPDERYTDRPSDAANEYLESLMKPEWGRRVPIGLRQEGERRTLFAKARLLDKIGGIESRLSMMARLGRNDLPYLNNTLRSLQGSIDLAQGMSSYERRSSFAELSAYDAQAALRILEPLKARVETLIRGR
jgi:uncharacterized protein YjbI with pentapeptide repeats